MEYVVSVAASAWQVPFVVLEHRVGGRPGYLWRLIGMVPFLVLAVLAWIGRFSYDALTITIFTILVITTVESVLRWRQRRAEARRTVG